MGRRPRKLRYRLGSLDEIDYVSDNVPDPDMARGVAVMLEGMARESAREWGWDVPPVLGGFHLRSRTPVGAAGWKGLEIEFRAFPDSTEMLMKAERSHHVMLHLAYGLQQADIPLPDDLIAFGLLTEGWGLFPKNVEDKAELARIRKAGENQQIHTLPERVECKIFSAVDVNGVRYGFMKPRDTDIPSQGFAALFDDQNLALGGEVPNSLHYLMLSAQGRTLPDYYEWSEQFEPEES